MWQIFTSIFCLYLVGMGQPHSHILWNNIGSSRNGVWFFNRQSIDYQSIIDHLQSIKTRRVPTNIFANRKPLRKNLSHKAFVDKFGEKNAATIFAYVSTEFFRIFRHRRITFLKNKTSKSEQVTSRNSLTREENIVYISPVSSECCSAKFLDK